MVGWREEAVVEGVDVVTAAEVEDIVDSIDTLVETVEEDDGLAVVVSAVLARFEVDAALDN